MEPEQGRAQLRRRSPVAVVVAIAGILAVVALVVGAVLVLSDREPDDHPAVADASPTAIASTVTCSAWHRPNDRVAPTSDGEITVDMTVPGEDHQSLTAGDFRFSTNFSWDQAFSGEGRSLGVSVSEVSGQPIVTHLYQIWSGPVDQFAGDHGFTGLVYVTHPTTGAELQYICKAS